MVCDRLSNILIDWDFDGTIADTEIAWYYIGKRYLRHFYNISQEQYDRLTIEVYSQEFAGISPLSFTEKATRLGFLNKEQAEKNISEKEAYDFILSCFLENLNGKPLGDEYQRPKFTQGTYDLIRWLDAKGKINNNIIQHITSASTKAALIANVQALANVNQDKADNILQKWLNDKVVLSCFDVMGADNQEVFQKVNAFYTGDDKNFCKPSPVVHIFSLLLALKDSRDIDTVIILEDSQTGVLSGKNFIDFLTNNRFAIERKTLGIKDGIQVKIIGYLLTKHHLPDDKLKQSGADIVVHSADEVKELL